LLRIAPVLAQIHADVTLRNDTMAACAAKVTKVGTVVAFRRSPGRRRPVQITTMKFSRTTWTLGAVTLTVC
jgi:hypothetical protein